MSKLHGVDANGRHLIVSLTADDFYEDATGGIRLYSRHDRAWVVQDAETLRPICFLDIPPDDRPVSLFRGRWLVIKSAVNRFMVNNREVDYEEPEEYIFDIDSSRRMEAPVGRLDGGYINTKDCRAISLSNGAVMTSSFLKGNDLLDYETISGDMNASTSSGLVLGSSPATPGFASMATKVYVMRKKTIPSDYIVYIGGGNDKKLSPVMHFSGIYWHTLGGYVAYNNRVCRVPITPNHHIDDAILTFESSLMSNGLAMVLRDAYFPRVGELCLLYESKNFHAIIVKKLDAYTP
jgi:hypothetical protein